jgi:hypothetical protein
MRRGGDALRGRWCCGGDAPLGTRLFEFVLRIPTRYSNNNKHKMPLVPARDLSDESDDPNDPDYSEGTEDDSNDAGDPNPRPRTRQRTNSASAATDLVTTADADGDLDIFTIFAVNDIIEELQRCTRAHSRTLA